jgi:hypothetical protein
VRPRWLCLAANALVVLSLADGALSLVDEVLREVSGVTGLLGPRALLARLVLVGVLASLPAMALTPRVPLPVFLPLAVGTLWRGLGAAPLGLWLDTPYALGVAGSVFQIGLAGIAFVAIRRHNGGRRWLFDAHSPEALACAWSRSLGFAGVSVVLGLPALGLYLMVLSATWVETTTQGFVAFDLGGVSLADRRYARDDQEVRLVGMMHIGEEDAYREIVSSFATVSTVVLAEGVTDREGRLQDALQYGGAAEALGLTPQQDLREYLLDPEDPDGPPPAWPEIRHADLDASAFGPETIEWLRWASGIWGARDLASALAEIAASVRESDPEALAAFQRDILDQRNQHLFGEIEAALEDYERVVVPWGALHLPAVEREVTGLGFEETSRELHELISWGTILAALF